MNQHSRFSRRDFLAGTAAMTLAPLCPTRAWANSALTDLDAVEAVRAMQTGEIRSEDYVRALLARCEELRHLNTFISLDSQLVLETARASDRARSGGAALGPLHGLPLAVKDSIHTSDYPTTAGTNALRNYRPQRDATVVAALRRAGGIVLGKTNLHELSYGYTSNNEAFGPVRNPYDPNRIPGGSSGGTAAAVAARMAPCGLAEDTCGSIRVPAALCGIAGLRPTTPRYPQSGVVPITPKFDQVGPHARSVRDLALIDSVITRDGTPLNPPRLAGTRIGVPRAYFWEDLDPEVARIAEETLGKLRDSGAVLIEADVPDIGKLSSAANWSILLYETIPSLQTYLDSYHSGMSVRQLIDAASPGVRWALETFALEGGAQAVPRATYEEAVKVHWPAAQKAYRDYFKLHGVVAAVFPATPLPATPIGQDAEVEHNGKTMPLFLALSRNIVPGNTAGIPGLVLPAGLTASGLPVALEFDGPQWRDRELLALGMAVEKVLGRLPAPGI